MRIYLHIAYNVNEIARNTKARRGHILNVLHKKHTVCIRIFVIYTVLTIYGSCTIILCMLCVVFEMSETAYVALK